VSGGAASASSEPDYSVIIAFQIWRLKNAEYG
jgi:hypothetical protein